MQAIILFGHGARDIRWREPFDRMAALWQAQHPNTPMALAFLELMQPSLEDAIVDLVSAGANSVRVIPVFFGQGGHLRNDFPVLLAACQDKFPNLLMSAAAPVGEDPAILQAVVDYGARELI